MCTVSQHCLTEQITGKLQLFDNKRLHTVILPTEIKLNDEFLLFRISFGKQVIYFKMDLNEFIKKNRPNIFEIFNTKKTKKTIKYCLCSF